MNVSLIFERRVTPYFAALQRKVPAYVREAQRSVPSVAITGVALVIPLLLFWVLNDRIMKGRLGYDEQFFAWGGWSITHGLRPYVDFFEFKPPLVFITHAFAIATCGDKGIYYRVFFSVCAAVSTLAVHASLLSRRIHRGISVALVCALIFAWVNPAYHDNALQDAESIGLIYYFLAVAALITNAGRYRKYFEILGGFFLACTVFSKEPFTGAVLGTWVTAFFLVYGVEGLKTQGLRYVMFTGIGAAAMLSALCTYMVPTGSMKRYIELVIEYAALFRDPKLSYCVVLGRWTPSTPWGELKAQAKYIYEQFFNASVLGYLIPLFVASFVFTWRRSKVLFATSFATFLLALYAVTATNCQWSHYYNMALSGMFFFLIVGVDSMNADVALADKPLSVYIAATLLAMGAFFITRIQSELKSWPYTFAPVPEPVPGVFDFVASNSSPSDRILTTGAPLLYMYVNRRSALRESSLLDEFIAYYPGNNDVEKLSGLRAELVKNRPKIVILDPESGLNRKRRHMASLLTPFLEEFHYRPVGQYFYVRPD